MEEQLEQSKQRLHFCMAVIGGWFGAYMVLRFGHLASAATVNLLEMLTGAAQENWPLALLRLGGLYCCHFPDGMAAQADAQRSAALGHSY